MSNWGVYMTFMGIHFWKYFKFNLNYTSEQIIMLTVPWDLFLTVHPLTHIWQRSFLPGCVRPPESIEWFIEDQAVSPSSWLCSSTTPPSPLPSASCLPFSAFLCLAGQAYWRESTAKTQYRKLEHILLEKKLRSLSPNFHIHVSVSDLYIPTIGLPILLQEIWEPIMGICKFLTDTWMWKLELRPRSSFSGNT